MSMLGPHAFPLLELTHNRALHPAAANILQKAEPYFAHHFEGTRGNSWYLHLLAVDPSYQNRGFGRELVDWGLEKARKEGVHASVISNDSKEPFYFKCGLDEIIGYMTSGEGKPLGVRNVRGGAIMFMWREGGPKHSS
ncbi:hypothetical protein E8E12_011768 [Didymella heteroderae]|uniref:N-acetyltransferase domain-containing protein n=1 Tax=Didymella heteroderae TaxID=1769908 RepID=A0A9P4X2L6_9PLEO|nr:hypothetical protein E8E12_011768 [Didymella heteroderae]